MKVQKIFQIVNKRLFSSLDKNIAFGQLLSCYKDLICEEIPGILAIVFFPSFFGLLILVPHATIVLCLITVFLLMLYLDIKGKKNYKIYSNDIRWDFFNLIASMILGIAISLIISISYTNQLINFKSCLSGSNK